MFYFGVSLFTLFAAISYFIFQRRINKRHLREKPSLNVYDINTVHEKFVQIRYIWRLLIIDWFKCYIKSRKTYLPWPSKKQIKANCSSPSISSSPLGNELINCLRKYVESMQWRVFSAGVIDKGKVSGILEKRINPSSHSLWTIRLSKLNTSFLRTADVWRETSVRALSFFNKGCTRWSKASLI